LANEKKKEHKENKKEKKKNIFVNINNTISDKRGLRGLRSEF